MQFSLVLLLPARLLIRTHLLQFHPRFFTLFSPWRFAVWFLMHLLFWWLLARINRIEIEIHISNHIFLLSISLVEFVLIPIIPQWNPCHPFSLHLLIQRHQRSINIIIKFNNFLVYLPIVEISRFLKMPVVNVQMMHIHRHINIFLVLPKFRYFRADVWLSCCKVMGSVDCGW